jgi:hypothetical protein
MYALPIPDGFPRPYIEVELSMSKEESEYNPGELLYPARESCEQPMLYCPVCSERLAESRCKLICKTCGYFMSCSDYY